MKKFWNWIRDDSGGRVLRLEGPIDEEYFWGDEITPQVFRDELEADEGDVTVWINSPGGNVFAAAEIYTMLRDYKGAVTVRIASIAASAASVVAMAGDLVQMSPTALLMVHDPSTIAFGNTRDMEKAIATLNEVKESIINAYMAKTGLSHNRIAKLMEDETWINAKKAVQMGFADEILFEEKAAEEPAEEEKPEQEEEGADGGEEEKPDKKQIGLEAGLPEGVLYSTRLMGQTILGRLGVSDRAKEKPAVESQEGNPPEGEPVVKPKDSTDAESKNTPAKGVPSENSAVPPVIGMDGRTEDGSVPYEILKERLEWLK